MTPFLMPIHVLACALDPDALKVIEERNAKSKDVKHHWSCNPPDYKSLASSSQEKVAPLWVGAFEDAAKEQSAPINRTRGVCVSWNPPKAWAGALPHKVRQGSKDEPALPALPDRWLVMRIARTITKDGQWVNKAPEKPKTWVIDVGVPLLDAKEAEASSSAEVLVRKGESLEVVKVGKVRTLQQAFEAEASEARYKLDIHGAAESPDLTFAAFAPANMNNLSFVDPLDDLQDLGDLSLSYVVVGWYRQPEADDPLWLMKNPGASRPQRSDKEIRDILGLFGEQQDLERVLGGDRSVFHGMVAHVDYWNAGSYGGPALGAPGAPIRYDQMWVGSDVDRDLKIHVGYGKTADEAFAALAAELGPNLQEGPTLRHREKFKEVLLSLFHDSLGLWDLPGADDRRRHAARLQGFYAARSGTEWIVRSSAQASKKAAEDKHTKGPELTVEELGLLDQLNYAQALLDQQAWTFASEAETLYAAWWLAQHELRVDAEGDDAKAFAEFINNYGNIVATFQKISKNDTLLETLKKKLKEELESGREKDAFEIVAGESPRFFVPKEPALAIRNVGHRVSGRPLDHRGRLLAECATASLAEDNRITGGGLEAAAALLSDAQNKTLPVALQGYSDASLTPALAALAREAALVEANVAALARVDRDGHAIAKPAQSGGEHVDTWLKRAGSLHKNLSYAGIPLADTFTELAPRPAFDPKQPPAIHARFVTGNAQTPKIALADLCTAWTQQPWAPVFLDWEVAWKSAPNEEPRHLRGRTLLANRPQRLIAERFEALRDDIVRDKKERIGPKAEVVIAEITPKAIEEAIALDVVTQALSGIHQQLQLRNDALPRRMPPAKDENGQANAIASLVENTSLGPPDAITDAFAGARGGSFVFKHLWVVDRFGQALECTPTTVFTPKESRAEDGSLAVGRGCFEPMRLQTQFVPAQDHSPGSTIGASGRLLRPAPQTPVRGWVLLNHLDDSIVIYDGAGVPQGVVQSSKSQGTAWRPIHAATVDALNDPTLVEFVQGIVGSGEARQTFEHLRQVIRKVTQRPMASGVAAGSSAVALLGRPLALVTANVRFERKGRAIAQPGYLKSYVTETSKGQVALPRDIVSRLTSKDLTLETLTEALGELDRALSPIIEKFTEKASPTEATVAVTLGSGSLADDGVVGYYTGTASKPIETTARFDPTKPATIHLQAPGLTQAEPTKLTLLLDPRGKVYLESDVLPATSAAVEPTRYQDALDHLPAVIRAAPLLLDSHDQLRTILKGPANAKQRISLPVSANVRPGRKAETRPAAQLSVRRTEDNTLVNADPVGPSSVVSDTEVAALEGLLIL